jgi:hypothetical protein
MTRTRRQWLKRASALGILGPAGISGLIQDALASGDLPPTPGINTLKGTATVNGIPAKIGTPVKLGDRVSTGTERGAMTIVVLGKDAYLLRESTTVIFEESKEKPGFLKQVLIAAGKLLAVFERRLESNRVQVRTKNATIGIRGTGMYLEAEDTRTYFCLCYGQAAIEGAGMTEPTIINTVHHENPLWLDDSGGKMKVEKGPFLNHTDDELIMLEKLTGRRPPFVALGLTGRY